MGLALIGSDCAATNLLKRAYNACKLGERCHNQGLKLESNVFPVPKSTRTNH
jgi:hypothetical protein